MTTERILEIIKSPYFIILISVFYGFIGWNRFKYLLKPMTKEDKERMLYEIEANKKNKIKSISTIYIIASITLVFILSIVFASIVSKNLDAGSGHIFITYIMGFIFAISLMAVLNIIFRTTIFIIKKH